MPDINDKKVLTVTYGERSSLDIYLLNPGDRFPYFGGSSRCLTVRKTGSCITREHQESGMRSDTELPLTGYKESGWPWVGIQARLDQRTELIVALRALMGAVATMQSSVGAISAMDDARELLQRIDPRGG